MKRGEKILSGACALAVAGLFALASPLAADVLPTVPTAAEQPTPSPTPKPHTTLDDSEGSRLTPLDKERVARFANCGGTTERADNGERRGANGTVRATDDEGLATIYRVASNDNLASIAERFCLNPSTITRLNGIASRSHIMTGDYYAFTESAQDDADRLGY